MNNKPLYDDNKRTKHTAEV